MSKKKAVLIFPDGVGVRNYLYSDVFRNTDADLMIFHDFDLETEKLISQISNVKQFYKIPKYKESFKEKFLRELICLSRLQHNSRVVKNPTILTNWKTDYKEYSKKLFYKVISKFSTTVKDYNGILKLEKLYQKAIRRTNFYDEITLVLGEIKPDLIFCAHQRGLQCAPIFAVAEDLKIKSSTVIFSWDNLPKARMALKADQYLVWSDYMKDEIKLYYPEISANKVVVTGTPQFEFYKDKTNVIEKSLFYEQYNLDADKKIICFSGDDTKTSPDDPKYLFDLASEITRNNLQEHFQILLRRCPVDISGRFDAVVNQFPDLIKVAAPIWSYNSSSKWSTVLALPEDISLLISTVYYSDIVINVGSTMAFDFAMFRKPCVFIAYDQDVKNDPEWSFTTIYKFQHFRSMPQNSAVFWWNSKAEISNILSSARYCKETEEWKDIILNDVGSSSQRITKALNL